MRDLEYVDVTYNHAHNPPSTVGDMKTDITMRQIFWDEYPI